MLALVLPVVPSFGLKESALAAVGMGGGGAAGGGGLIAAIGAHGAATVAAVAIATGGAVVGVAVTHPQLVSKAQAALERVADDVRGGGVSNTSISGRVRSDAGRANGSFEGDTAQKTAGKKARRDKMSAPRDPIADAEKRKESPGRGRESGVEGPVRSKPPKAHAHGQDRAAAARSDRSRGRRGSPSRGRPAGTPGGGGDKERGQRRLNLPEPGANRRPERSLPRGGKGGPARALRDPVNRGRDRAKGATRRN